MAKPPLWSAAATPPLISSSAPRGSRKAARPMTFSYAASMLRGAASMVVGVVRWATAVRLAVLGHGLAAEGNLFRSVCRGSVHLLSSLLFFVPAVHGDELHYAVAGDANFCMPACVQNALEITAHPGYAEWPSDVMFVALQAGGGVVATVNGPDPHVATLLSDGRRQPLFSDPRLDRVGGITAAADGRIFLSATFDATDTVLEISASGELLATHPVTGDVHRAIDLGADQCTLYLSAFYGGVARYDVCRDERLPTIITDFAQHDVRALPNGDVLVAAMGSNLNFLYRYDSSGALIRSYEFGADDAPSAIALEDDQTAVVATLGPSFVGGGSFFRLDLSSGRLTQPWPSPYTTLIHSPRSLVVYRGFTAALGPTMRVPSDVPSVTPSGVVGLVAVLALIAVRRLT